MIPNSVTVSEADRAAGSFAGAYDHDGNHDTDPLAGTFSYPEGSACALDTDAEGRIAAISGYTFTGAGPARPAREAPDEDYLVFGIWLNSPALLPSVGAFASGNAPFEAGTGGATLRAIEGAAVWRGPATGIHATSGANRPFDATATLNASFGEATSFGKISGTIGDIVSGGETVADSIVLIEAPLDAYASTGYFQGAARMWEAEDPTAAVPVYPYNGRWSGLFYGHGAMAPDIRATPQASSAFPGARTATGKALSARSARTGSRNSRKDCRRSPSREAPRVCYICCPFYGPLNRVLRDFVVRIRRVPIRRSRIMRTGGQPRRWRTSTRWLS